MNKKGFTLTEILCVVVLLGIISVIASTGIITMTKNTNENLYCAKLDLLKTSAIEYGESRIKELESSTKTYQGNKSLTITVNDLINNGFPLDDEENVLNPLDNSSLNSLEITLYLKNNQVYAYINDNNIC